MKKSSHFFYYLLATVRIWCIANFSESKCWRVKYDNEPRFTRLLGKSEAKGLAEIFEGKAWIDYEHCC